MAQIQDYFLFGTGILLIQSLVSVKTLQISYCMQYRNNENQSRKNLKR